MSFTHMTGTSSCRPRYSTTMSFDLNMSVGFLPMDSNAALKSFRSASIRCCVKPPWRKRFTLASTTCSRSFARTLSWALMNMARPATQLSTTIFEDSVTSKRSFSTLTHSAVSFAGNKRPALS